MSGDFLFSLLIDMIFYAIPAVGFSLVFNVPTYALKYCAIGGAIGHITRSTMIHFGMTIEWASFGAALMIGILGIYWGKRMLVPPKVFTVAGVIPLMPGVFAFKAVLALVEINSLGYSAALWETLVNNALKSIFILGALVIGLAMPGLLFYRRKSVV